MKEWSNSILTLPLVLTGATSTVGLYPLETLRTRLAMGDYDSLLHAVRTITAEEGFMAFYQVSLHLIFCSLELLFFHISYMQESREHCKPPSLLA